MYEIRTELPTKVSATKSVSCTSYSSSVTLNLQYDLYNAGGRFEVARMLAERVINDNLGYGGILYFVTN